MFVMFSVFDRLFIKCKYFSIGSRGGAQVYVKKIIGLQGNADNSSKIDYLWPKLCGYFSREVMFDTLSNRRKSVPSFSPLPYSWFPLGQGRNNKMAYSLNLQTPSLP